MASSPLRSNTNVFYLTALYLLPSSRTHLAKTAMKITHATKTLLPTRALRWTRTNALTFLTSSNLTAKMNLVLASTPLRRIKTGKTLTLLLCWRDKLT
jgi:hypothetical protein